MPRRPSAGKPASDPPGPPPPRHGALRMDLTHASFFSGVGGTALGLERAGWGTVSFSQIDPYACAVLAQRWPGGPNLGDIVTLAGGEGGRRLRQPDLHDGGPR